MATVMNRITGELRPSVNTPDYPVEDWIHAPDLSAVRGIAPHYWKIERDNVVAMTTQERATVDAARLEQAKAARAESLKAQAVDAARDELVALTTTTKARLASALADVSAASTVEEINAIKISREA